MLIFYGLYLLKQSVLLISGKLGNLSYYSRKHGNEREHPHTMLVGDSTHNYDDYWLIKKNIKKEQA